MKIAFLGTKGIPNNYGGFEQFVEYLSAGLSNRGHDVTVYIPHYHPHVGDFLGEIRIQRFYCPEKYLGGAAHYLYDHLCLQDALRRNFDIVYEAGYASCAFAIWHFKKKRKLPIIVTNMDGMEWKRSKWNAAVRFITRRAEKIAVKYSDFLVADNLGIKTYIQNKYGVTAAFLPYGAHPVRHFNVEILKNYSLKPNEYFLLIARLEPENNVEIIIKGFLMSQSKLSLIIIGGLSTKHSKKLLSYKASNPNIIFLGGLYDMHALNNLRHFSKAYFHGHMVGGTNPSLLEAMACSSFIIAHDNEFNRAVLNDNALFFKDELDVRNRIQQLDKSIQEFETEFKKRNLLLIESRYDWNLIIDSHEKFFVELLREGKILTEDFLSIKGRP